MVRDLIGTNLLIDQKSKNAFNLDTILLADFASFRYNAKQVMDFGCGNGAISLYLSEKTTASIIGIDIQEELVNEAINNVILNKLENKITIIHDDIKNLPNKFRNIDAICCNPPFFKVQDNSKMNLEDKRRVARHEVHINLKDIIETASKLLKTRGQLFLIHRPERLNEIITLCEVNRLVIKRIRFVHPYLEKEANHILVEIHKDGKEELKVEPPLILYKDKGKISEELEKIYKGGNYVT